MRPEPENQAVYIRNWNYAGAYVFFWIALVGLTAGFVALAANGGLKNKAGETD